MASDMYVYMAKAGINKLYIHIYEMIIKSLMTKKQAIMLDNDPTWHIRRWWDPLFKLSGVCFALGKLYDLAHPKMIGHGSQSFQPKGTSVKFGESGRKDLGQQPKTVSNSKRHDLVMIGEQEKRGKDLFYFSDEYSPTHYLKHKKSQLFVLEAVEKDQDKVTLGKRLRISVNVVAHVSTYKTMRVKGMLGCKMSTISIEDGSKLSASGKIEGFGCHFQHVPFKADMMVIPLGGCDMVLGLQWLEHWGELSMEFKVDNKKLILKGRKGKLVIGNDVALKDKVAHMVALCRFY
ncbi:hypothetical protein V2J09_003289 [Rumex salicifolius]